MPYIIRLDDACEKRNIKKWDRIETMLDQYGIIPLVGIIPHCEDKMMECYPVDEKFWTTVQKWIEKGWIIALHGYSHVYHKSGGGINPVNSISEFADTPLEIQKQKILEGLKIFNAHGISPDVFFAPAHTFDENTLTALRECSDIRIISDTIANDIYYNNGFTFVPQQAGHVRTIPLKTTTFCYHPNVMIENDFVVLEKFLKDNSEKFIRFPINEAHRRKTFADLLLTFLYFSMHKIRKLGKCNHE